MRKLARNNELHAPSDNPSITEQMTDMIELDELSEADVKHDRCPMCKNKRLEQQDGFKICPRCQTMFKMLDGQGYVVCDDKPQSFQINDFRGGTQKMSNRILERMLKLANDTEEQTTGDKFLDAFNSISKEQLKKWADEAVDTVISDVDFVDMAVDKYGIEEVNEEIIISDNLDYIEDYLWDSIVNSKEFEALGNPDLYAMNQQIISSIRELSQSGGSKDGWKEFEKLLSDRAEQEERDSVENRDPWRGTGMSQKYFV